MIQFQDTIADAYVHPSRNIAMPSMPGRQVKFLQGHAAIRDGRDLAAMMKRPDVKIVLTPFVMSWIEEIEKSVGEVRAEVLYPEVEGPGAWDPTLRPHADNRPGPDTRTE